MTAYVCSNCAGTSTEINPAHPSLDDRYPVGHCVSCTPWPKPIVAPDGKTYTQPLRKTIALVRADVFNRADYDHRKVVADMRKLAAKLQSKTATKMSDSELSAARAAVVWLQREDA